MARKKKKTKKKKKTSPGLILRLAENFASEQGAFTRKWLVFVIIFTVISISLSMGFGRLEDYVNQVTRQRDIKLGVQMDQPKWATENFIKEICRSSGIKCDDFLLDETLIEEASKKLQANPWVKNVRQIRKRYDGVVIIDCDFREPVASIRHNERVYFVDAEGVVLPWMDTTLHMVKLEGFVESGLTVGQKIASKPLKAGLEVLVKICEVEGRITQPNNRLWDELKLINVSNFAGKTNECQPHLKLLTMRNNEIGWGAAIGQEVTFMEPSYTNKLYRLYQTHGLYNTLDEFNYIELRNQRNDKSDPRRKRS